jgi:CelD/BcsL family acetyltransferase involved in cellulose biosynthesis
MNVSLMNAPSRDEVAVAESTLHCELITDFSSLEELSADWECLWHADPDAEIFQSFGWARAWWRCYADKVALCSLAVFEGNRVIGIVPLVKEEDTIVLLGGRHADYCNLLFENGREAEVFEAALEALLQLPDWKKCVLRNLKVGGQIFQQLPALPKRLRRHLQMVPCEDCHTILLGENRDVLVSLLGKEHTKRRMNKLRKAGTLRFRHIETRVEAEAELSQFFLHQMRRRALAGKDCPPPEFCMFLRNLVDELDLGKELRFGVLKLSDRSLAWHLSFQVNGKLLFYQQTFDVDVWDYSPGEVLIHELLSYAQENVTRELDFTRGNEPFKDRFTTHSQESYSLYLERSGILGQLRLVARASAIPWLRLGRRIQHLAKRHAETFHGFRSIRLWASGVRARVRYHRHERTLITWALNGVERLFRSMRFGTKKIYFFPPNCQSSNASDPGDSDSNLSVREGSLGDLVDIALQHPEIVVPFELGKYRRRLKKGDQFYLVWQGKELVLVGWITMPTAGDILQHSASQQVSGGARLMVLYDCWAVSDAPENVHYRRLLCAVSKVATKKQMVLGVRCTKGSRLHAELTCSEG